MNWLDALTSLKADSQAHVLLTVLATRGSSPRDVGTKMVVSKNNIYDTIGGGALEHQSIEMARGFLKNQQAIQHTETFNLGKDLKQCCGGVVSVFFEVFPASNFIINIFGAGHIGQALCTVLAGIDCTVNLFDSRPEQLQSSYPKPIKTHILSEVELVVESCAANSYFLVMTHDHALDQQLCEAILSRADSVYCGVIGSRTKGIKFRQRLSKKGFSADELARLTCPMGLSELHTKKPMEIAVSVMAELLMLRNTQTHNDISDTNVKDDIDIENNATDADKNIIRLENRD